MARQDFELKQATYQAQQATVRESEARLTQARAQREQQAANLTSMQRHIAQARAGLTMVADVLQKHSSFAPLDGG
jgi:multidrug resistance efflux pump